jgi:2-methylcitrate dehydratase
VHPRVLMSVATDHELMLRSPAAAAHAAAGLALEDALTCALLAVQQPACARLLGPLVPGATMGFGARVPGTSYQLDPVHAAFNIGTMISWLGANEPLLQSRCGHLADNLGAILAVGDYRARKSIAEGAPPPTVHDLLVAVVAAHDCAAQEASRLLAAQERSCTGALHSIDRPTRCALVRIASASASMTLLGGSPTQVDAAVALARAEVVTAASSATDCRWHLGDATSRGVRLALLAAAGTPAAAAQPGHRPADAALRTTSTATGTTAENNPWQPVVDDPAVGIRIRERFTAATVGFFPPAQAGKILGLFADQVRFSALPINELVSMTVRN